MRFATEVRDIELVYIWFTTMLETNTEVLGATGGRSTASGD